MLSAGLQRRGSIESCPREWLEDLMQVNTISQFILARDFAAYRKRVYENKLKLGASEAELNAHNVSNGKLVFIASMQAFTGGVNVTG